MGDALLILLLHAAGPALGAGLLIWRGRVRRADHVWYAAVAGQVLVAPTVLLLALGAHGAVRPALRLLRRIAPDPPPVSGVQVHYVALLGTLIYLFCAGALVGAAVALLWRRYGARSPRQPTAMTRRRDLDWPA